jgi:Divergent InlB B-repeat domain/Glycosyl hydrolases family 16
LWVVHPWNGDGSQAPQPYEGGSWVNVPGGDAINDWHVYGCEVAPDFIRFYIDGQEVGRKPTNLDYLREPLYVILNYALERNHPGEPFASFGESRMQVDWVRAYSLPANVPLPPTPPPTLTPKQVKRKLTVMSGSGDGRYYPGMDILVTADNPPRRYVFDRWAGDWQFLSDHLSPTTSFKMPKRNASITARYRRTKALDRSAVFTHR